MNTFNRLPAGRHSRCFAFASPTVIPPLNAGGIHWSPHPGEIVAGDVGTRCLVTVHEGHQSKAMVPALDARLPS
jgi:hypothetical protein